MLEKKLTCQIICNFVDISFSLRYNGRKKVTCYQFSDDLLQLQPEKGGSLVQYIVIIGIKTGNASFAVQFTKGGSVTCLTR